MSRVFSIPTVLRQAPNRLIRQLLERLGLQDLEIPWDGLAEKDIDSIGDALNDLTDPEYDAVEGALRTVFDLACATGVAAIRDARDCSKPGESNDLPADAGLYEQAMWAWLNWPEDVEQAMLLHQLDHLHWWRRRDDLPRRQPDTSPEARERMGLEISELLRREEGRGRNCTVEAYARRGTTCYFAFPDDHVLNAIAHDDDGRLAPRTFRRTFTVVFAFDPEEGSLELYAKVGVGVKAELEQIFARVTLGLDLPEWKPDPAYEPNALRERDFRMDIDPEDNVRVDVKQLRLSSVTGHRQITLRGDPEHPGDVFRMVEEVLDGEAASPSAYNITLITFQFRFLAVGRRRAGSVTFDVAFPNSCSLRNQRPERMAVIMKYLRRWGIHVERPAGPRLGAA